VGMAKRRVTKNKQPITKQHQTKTTIQTNKKNIERKIRVTTQHILVRNIHLEAEV